MLQGVPNWGYIRKISVSNMLHSTILQGRYTRLPQPVSSAVLLPHISTEEEGEGKDISFSPLASVATASYAANLPLTFMVCSKVPYLCIYFHSLRIKTS